MEKEGRKIEGKENRTEDRRQYIQFLNSDARSYVNIRMLNSALY